MTATELVAWPHAEELWERYFPQVFTLALRLTGKRTDAEDLTQDVFLRLIGSEPAYQPGNLAGWIHRVTTNLFLDGVRRRKRRPETPLGELQEVLVGSGMQPETLLHDAGFDPDVEAALASLPVNFRVAVILSDVEQLPADEVAQILGIKVGTVRTRVHRGRTLLRRELAHRAPSNGRLRVAGPLSV